MFRFLNSKQSNSLNPPLIELPTHVKQCKLFSRRFVFQVPFCGKSVSIYYINFGLAHPARTFSQPHKYPCHRVSVSDISSDLRLRTI